MAHSLILWSLRSFRLKFFKNFYGIYITFGHQFFCLIQFLLKLTFC